MDDLLSPTPLVTAVTPSHSRAPPADNGAASPGAPACGRPQQQRMQVVLRIRPHGEGEPPSCMAELGGESVSIAQAFDPDEASAAHAPQTPSRASGRATPSASRRASEAHRFSFDAVAGEEGGAQADLFAHARPLVLSALSGGHACVLAYGQTGSGKTHTMVGSEGCPGVVPRASDLVWDRIDATPQTEWHVSLTAVELHNDLFRDLLAADTAGATPAAAEAARRAQAAISLREAKSVRGGPPVAYLSGSSTFRTPVPSRDAMNSLLARALAARAVSATATNDHSSRSHVILTLHLDSRPPGGAMVRCGKLTLVDLAGSEAHGAALDAAGATESIAIKAPLDAPWT